MTLGPTFEETTELEVPCVLLLSSASLRKASSSEESFRLILFLEAPLDVLASPASVRLSVSFLAPASVRDSALVRKLSRPYLCLEHAVACDARLSNRRQPQSPVSPGYPPGSCPTCCSLPSSSESGIVSDSRALFCLLWCASSGWISSAISLHSPRLDGAKAP